MFYGALSKLSDFKYFDLSYNRMNGRIVPYFGGMSSLKTLKLGENNMGEGFDLNGTHANLISISKDILYNFFIIINFFNVFDKNYLL